MPRKLTPDTPPFDSEGEQMDPQVPDPLQLAEENAALKARQDQMLNMMVELQEQLDAVKASQQHHVTFADSKSPDDAAMEAELEALKQELPDFAGWEVYEQNLLVGTAVSTDIRLLGEPSVVQDPLGKTRYWHLRSFNLERQGRASQAEAQGYVKVKWSELQSAESVVAMSNERKDEYVRMGDRGLEVLYKLPRKLYDYKKKREAMLRDGRLSSESALRDYLANGVASMAGREGGNADQAGSFVANQKRGGMTVSISKGEADSLTLR